MLRTCVVMHYRHACDGCGAVGPTRTDPDAALDAAAEQGFRRVEARTPVVGAAYTKTLCAECAAPPAAASS